MTTDTQLAPTDAELLGLNVGEVYFSESPSKYPEVHGTQYHAGAPGVLAFARAVLAKWGQPAHSGEPVAWRYVPSKAWGEFVYTEDPKRAQHARDNGIDVQPVFTTPQPTQAQAGAVESAEFDQFLSDVLTAAGLVTHGKQCKALGERLADMCMKLRIHGIKGGQPASKEKSNE